MVCAIALTGAAFAVAGGSATKVSVSLKEFKVIPLPAKAKPGAVTFSVKNTGKIAHELVVLKTTIAPSKLPKQGAKAKEIGRVGRLASVKPGGTGKLTLTLKAGAYVLICNLPAHYGAGQYAGFKVA